MEDRSKAANKLNELLQKNYEAEKGYRKAAENSENGLLKSLLESEASKRHDFGVQIEQEIVKLGGMTEKSTSTESKVHRTWMDVKAALAPKTDNAIVKECERGDQVAIKDYEKVLKENELTASSRKLVQQQREEITDRYHEWKNFKL